MEWMGSLKIQTSQSKLAGIVLTFERKRGRRSRNLKDLRRKNVGSAAVLLWQSAGVPELKTASSWNILAVHTLIIANMMARTSNR